MDFAGKVCVITGGALGIGRCLTREFAKHGCKVAFIDINKAAGEQNLQHIQSNYGEGLFYCGDLTNQSTLQEFVDMTIEKFGRLDYLINNACISKRGILSDCSYDDFNYVLQLGVTAPYMLSKLFLKYFNEGAAIVNISSTRANASQPDTESYTAAKGGIAALTHALAVSLAGKVRVNSISPGWIDVREYYDDCDACQYDHSEADQSQHPVGRIGHARDMAKLAMFLCHQDSGFITGEDITVDGGMSKLMIYHGDHGWRHT